VFTVLRGGAFQLILGLFQFTRVVHGKLLSLVMDSLRCIVEERHSFLFLGIYMYEAIQSRPSGRGVGSGRRRELAAVCLVEGYPFLTIFCFRLS